MLDDSQKLALRIKKLRDEKNISQTELARIIGVSVGAVGNWESGTRRPDFQSLSKLAKYFGVWTDYLLGNADCPNYTPNSNQLYAKKAAEDYASSQPLPAPLEIPENLRNIPVAFHDGMEGLTQDDVEAVEDFIEFIKNKKRK